MKSTVAVLLLMPLLLSACGDGGTASQPVVKDPPPAERPSDTAAPGATDAERYRDAFGQIKEIEKALAMFKMETGRFPDNLLELTGEVGVHDEGLLSMIPKDPWGNEYIYDPAGGTKRRYLLITMGPDECEGTEDDLTNEVQPPAMQGK